MIKTIEEAKVIADKTLSPQELIDLYEQVRMNYVQTEVEEYDYEQGTEEYRKACERTDAWSVLEDELEARIIERARAEGLLAGEIKAGEYFEKLSPYMNKCGYVSSGGWWFKTEADGDVPDDEDDVRIAFN